MNTIDKRRAELEILARQEPLCETDWVKLIEARIALIKDHFRDMSLPSLGKLKITSDSLTSNELAYHWPETEGDDVMFNLVGIFPGTNHLSLDLAHIEFIRGTPDGSGPAIGAYHRFWCLSRNCEWFNITVQTETRFRGEKQRKYEHCTKLTVVPSTLLEACAFRKCTLESVYCRLGKIVKDWVVDREGFLNTARRIEAIILTAEDQLEYIPRV